jgi:hypothetical protein
MEFAEVWRMLMEASYAEQLKSNVADMKNTGGDRCGSAGAAPQKWQQLVATPSSSSSGSSASCIDDRDSAKKCNTGWSKCCCSLATCKAVGARPATTFPARY